MHEKKIVNGYFQDAKVIVTILKYMTVIQTFLYENEILPEVQS